MTATRFHTPATLDEALGLLDEHGDDARLFAGGTAMVTLMKQSLLAADHLVSLQRVPGLEGVRLEADGLHIGALTRHRDVETSDLVRVYAPLLAHVYSRVATVRIRNAATVGGGLAHADPAQDPPAALIALDARVRIASRRSVRELPVEELFVDYYETALAPGEAITELIVPRQPADAGAVYLKFLPRTEDDYATVAVAALARIVDGRAHGVRVALIAAGPTPVRATVVERALEGAPITAEAVRRAAEAVVDAVDPLDDFRGSAGYKRDMAVVFTRRALERALGLSPA
ncbi:MAG: xanthine dehydrogenase family protein subunit M [Chloroflexi bacterium]|nr:xanthine dehydrogenase family protein subunit M [Chloroflexota bacterium]